MSSIKGGAGRRLTLEKPSRAARAREEEKTQRRGSGGGGGGEVEGGVGCINGPLYCSVLLK